MSVEEVDGGSEDGAEIYEMVSGRGGEGAKGDKVECRHGVGFRVECWGQVRWV